MRTYASKTGAVLLAVLVLATVGHAVQEPDAEAMAVGGFEEGVPGGVIINTLALQAKVIAIDYETREVALLMPGGSIRVVAVGPEAINFNQIQKGDMVKALVTEELVVQMGSEDSELKDGEEVVAVRAPEGAMPGGVVADTVRMTATVMVIDAEARTAILRFEDGGMKTVSVRDDIDLAQHKVGEKVVFEITQMVALSVEKQETAVDPVATQLLKRMTDTISSLKQFRVDTQTTFEDLLDSGHRVDLDVSARAIVSRPNKILAERRGEQVDQVFYYDGTNLTLFNPPDNVYATVPAPATIEGTLHYVRDSLGLNIPIADLLYSNAFTLLMENVNLALVVEKSVINGIECDQLLFSRPGVDFQIWITDNNPSLPLKYVVTDTSVHPRLSTTTVLSNWDLSPDVADDTFTFMTPKDATSISFLFLEPSNSIQRQP